MRWWCRLVGVLAIMISLLGSVAQAQDAPKSGFVLPQPLVISAPLYMEADQLIYDTRGNRVVAQGSVEIYWNNYILTADQVIYQHGANSLVAEGNVQLKDPNGSVTRGDHVEAFDNLRDAFVQSLNIGQRLYVPAPR